MPLVRGHYPPMSVEHLLAGSPAGVYRTNLPPQVQANQAAAFTSAQMALVALPVQAGDRITSLSFKSGTTAAATLTNHWFALYDDSATAVLLAQTADQEAAAWAANTVKTLALASVVEVPRSTVYYAAVMVKASTVQTLIGAAVHDGGGFLSTDKPVARLGATGLTATAPATQVLTTASVFAPKVVAT